MIIRGFILQDECLAFGWFSSLRTIPGGGLLRASFMRSYGAGQEERFTMAFLLHTIPALARIIACEKRPPKQLPMAKFKKNKNKAKLNLTVRDEQRNKLEQMASLEKRSVSNLIEVMADERWERLAEQQGVAYAKTVADAMNLKVDMDNPADREKLRRAVLDLVAGRKTPK
jgi:uncharacterized protein (DUF1778 family)